jgi:class 3 adenylate cyclase/tetratricopeptide (TPR) repeat protein
VTPPGPATVPHDYTPPHLAAKILTGRGALEGERRQVTVLFADVAGFTALAERLDPEEVHQVMEGCIRILMDEVHRYEGTINQFTGDGVMALFGAPIAHENAPERAVRAALGMQAALADYGENLRGTRGFDLRMRIGINTGPVVVGKIGDDLRMEYTAVGDSINLAARLQTVAPPGGIVVSDHTARLISGRFVTRALGPLTLKGKSKPVAAHEVVRALPRAPLVAAEHGLTPLVGRTTELAALETVFSHAATSRGQVAFVVGEAGIGKSRLIHELRQRLRDREHTWLEGRCVSFSREIPLLPVTDLLKALLGIEENDSEADIGAKIHAGVAALGPELDATEPYLRALLAIDPGNPAVAAMDASARRFATFDALKQVMLSAATRRPLVVLIEDLHWIDQASEEWLTFVIDVLAGARVLLLCTYRPGYRPVIGERSFVTRLALQPLSPEETVTMTRGVLASPTAADHPSSSALAKLPQDVAALVIAKAEGNPFFIEEVTKSLVEMDALRLGEEGYTSGRPLADIVIPDTIQGVIMARIDRLADEEKRAIQIASVIGREFAVRLLQRASDFATGVDTLMGELRALELIYEKSGVPELAYMFKHALTHDVAYASLLVQRRRHLHRVIGLAIEELYADRLGEYWETLVHHFYEGEDWPRAFEYARKAGDKARAAFANTEAVYFYGRALEVAPRLEIAAETMSAIHAGKASAHFCLSEFPEANAAYRHAIETAGDHALRARLEAKLGETLVWGHDFDAAVVVARQARETARAAGDPAADAHATFVIGYVHGVRGELDAATSCIAEARRLAAAGPDAARVAQCDVFRALMHNWRGQYRAAVEITAPVVAVLEKANELLLLVEVLSHYTITLGGAGEYPYALDLLATGIARAESIGDKVWRARMWNTRGWILADLGAFDAAEEANRRCVEIARQVGTLQIVPELIGNAEANLADLALARGDLAGAGRHLEAVATIVGDHQNEWMRWRYGMHYQISAAELALARGDLAQARERITACLGTAERTGSRRYLVRANRLLAAAHVAAGDPTTAAQLLATVVRDARQLGNPPQRWHALLAYGRVLHTLGRRDDATTCWHEGRDLITSVTNALPPDLASTFQSAPLTATLSELSA